MRAHSFWMFFVVAVDMLWQPVPYKFLQVCGGQCGQGRRRHDPWWHQSYGEAGRLPRVPAKRRSSVETDGDLGVSWENLGKWWENDGKMMMYGTSWPNWRSRSSVSRLAYGRTVWSRCFFFREYLPCNSSRWVLRCFGEGLWNDNERQLRRNSGSTTTNMTSSRSNPTRVATRLGWKELAPPSNYGATPAWELNASFGYGWA